MYNVGSRVAVVGLALTLLCTSARARAPKHEQVKRHAGPRGAAAAPGAKKRPAPRPAPRPPGAHDPALHKRVKALEKKLNKLRQAYEDLEIKQLRMESTVESVTPEKEEFKTKTFSGHARALQGLNPELSVISDMAGVFLWSHGREYSGDERSGFHLREMGLHFQSALDPFSYMSATISLSSEEVELEEAYIVWTAVAGVMNIMVGKFRQQVGVLNRWHTHGLDQTNYPLMLTEPFGPEGLDQIGVSFNFLLPKITASANELTVQITNGMNENAFSGTTFSVPTTLVYFKNYWDLSNSTYLELGLTGILGFNNQRGATTQGSVFTDQAHLTLFHLYDDQGNEVPLSFAPAGPVVDEKWRVTAFGGANLTLSWEPMKQGKYRGVIWRSAFLYGYKQLAPDATGERQSINWMGGYSYVQAKLTRSFALGVRGDLVRTFEPGDDHHYKYHVVPHLVWWQSPWVRFRLEYNYQDGDAMAPVHRFIAQVVFAAGPHKHDRY